MLNKASALFSRRSADLQSYIYGTSALADAAKKVIAPEPIVTLKCMSGFALFMSITCAGTSNPAAFAAKVRRPCPVDVEGLLCRQQYWVHCSMSGQWQVYE